MFLSPLRFAARYQTTTLEGTPAEVETKLQPSTNNSQIISATVNGEQVGSIWFWNGDSNVILLDLENTGKDRHTSIPKNNSCVYRGVGSMLLRELCKFVHDNKPITLESSDKSIAFYTKMPFDAPDSSQPLSLKGHIKKLKEYLDKKLKPHCLEE